MQQKLKQAVSISRGVDWNLCACLVKFPPDIVTPEELNRKTGSVNCIRTGIMWLFVFAGAMVLSCTSGLSLSDTETEGVRIVLSKEKETKSKHTLYMRKVMKDQMMFQDNVEAKNRPFSPSNFFLPSSGKIHRILEHIPKRNVVFVVSAARVPYILRTLFPGSATVTTAMLEMFPSCRKDDTGHLFTSHITS
jgi:hypothetical protein